jgi:RNA polymerase sigma-70 factor (ECF subfamily)
LALIEKYDAWMMTTEKPAVPSFEQVFHTHWERIYLVLFRMLGDPAAAEDLALETFLRLHREPRLLDLEHNTAGWLYRVATNLGYNAIRAGKRRGFYEAEAGKDQLARRNSPDPELELERKQQQLTVREVLRTMKPRAAKLLVLRHSGFSYAECAEILGVSPSSIGTLLNRAESAFKKMYLEFENASG